MLLCKHDNFGKFFSFAVVSSSLCCSNIASAQDVAAQNGQPVQMTSLAPREENGRQIYDVAQFERFAPQTAADMVRQIPGFTISQISSDRGLGEASQNVLVNGRRISGKSDDAQTVLARTSARSVVRLEIADSALYNISGLNGQVLNVVTQADDFSGNFAWRPTLRGVGNHYLYGGEMTANGTLAGGSFTIGLDNNHGSAGGGAGFEQVRDANGDLLFTRTARRRFIFDRPRLNASYGRASSGGDILNARVAIERPRMRRDIRNIRQTLNAFDILETDQSKEDEWNIESSGDYEFGLGSGRLKLIGFYRFEHSPIDSLFQLDFEDGSTRRGSRFERVIDEGEAVARTEYRWKSGRADWQISAEAALNYLDSTADLFRTDAAGIYQPVAIPGANARVEEKRAQLIVSFARPLNEDLSVQATLGGEYSNLGQTGPGDLTRTFLRPKGSLSLAWTASPQLSLSGRVQRKVGQLNFGDFLASVDVVNNNDNANNPVLVPPQSWLAELEINRKLGPVGSVNLKLEAESISDIVDRIPISATTEAPGNIASASRFLADLTTTFLLDSAGWKGAKLDIRARGQKSRVRDPLTNELRSINNELRYAFELGLRHDIPASNLAWGGEVEIFDYGYFNRLDYSFRDAPAKPFVNVFIEHKNLLGLKLKAELNNVNNRTAQHREVFYAKRRDGPIAFTENLTVRYGRELRLNVSGTF